MTPPRDIVGTLRVSAPFRNVRLRRSIFAVAVLLCAVLTLFPQKYRAAMSLTPTDPSALGLGNALGESGAVNTVFGNQAAVEIVLRVGKSGQTRADVIRKLDLMKRKGFSSPVAADRWLEKAVVIRSLRGGIVAIESWQTDAAFARELVTALLEATRAKLTQIGRRQTAYKRKILEQLLADADERLAVAQANYDQFRLQTRYAQPTSAIGSIATRVAALKDAIRNKEVELYAARQFATDTNLSVRQLIAQLSSLRVQLAQAQSLNDNNTDSVGDVVQKSTRIRELDRLLLIAHTRHDSYERLLEGTAVEDITENAVIRIIEAPYVDSARQFNLLPMTIGIVLLLIALAIEFYGLRPPVGAPEHRV